MTVSNGTIHHGLPALWREDTPTGVEFRAVFGRRIDYLAAGLTYTVEFSADLVTWESIVSEPVPDLLDWDAEIEVVSVPYPSALSTGAKPQYFHIVVTGF